jgi:hypothetical protein
LAAAQSFTIDPWENQNPNLGLPFFVLRWLMLINSQKVNIDPFAQFRRIQESSYFR